MTAHFNLVAHLTWDVAARRLAAGAIAVVPVGAGAKQHGLHLPMMTDQLLAEHFARLLAEQIAAIGDALIWPTLTYGFYPAFAAYPGSVTLPQAQFQDLMSTLIQGLVGCGARRVIIVDAGLSTRGSIQSAIENNPSAGGVSRFGIFEGAHFQDAVERHKRQRHGSHADEIETSIMLALWPELVDMARAVASPSLANGPQLGPLERGNPASPNFSPSGSFGDPTLANLELGRLLVAAILADLSGIPIG